MSTDHIPDRLSQMLELQRSLQVNSYGKDPGKLVGDERVQFVKDMVLAATSELHEFLDETNWKPWSIGDQCNKPLMRKELVDLWHFVMNLMLVSGMSADQLYHMYRDKREVNARRQQQGYDGTSTKCPTCKRALEDVGLDTNATDSQAVSHTTQCCGTTIDPDVARQLLESWAQ